ncbi:MAG: hypothetical protein LLF76_03760 [Planctomycetaceae bacterium]|nr:hypothetical protein [Planctomycetaceae bacterium]
MPRKTDRESGRGLATQHFVTVAFAEDADLAREYIELLERNEISAQMKRQPEMAESGFSDIAICVPEECLDEAHKLISQQAAYDDFFDQAFSQDDYLDYDPLSGDEPEDDEDLLY